MIEKRIGTEVYGVPSKFTLRFYGEEDIPWLKRVFDSWQGLNMCLGGGAAGGTELTHKERKVNVPEAISEIMYCLIENAGRYHRTKTDNLKDSSFDAYNVITGKTIQLKSTQIEYDCTSFGPNSKQDKLVFMDLYNDGNIDGTVDVYDIPYDLIKISLENKKLGITFEERLLEGKRPRLSVKKSVIIPHNIQPIHKGIKLW